MCFRQVELFLHAVAQTDAEPFTTTEGNQRLAQLVTGTVLISPGVDEVGQTLQAIGLTGHHQHAKAEYAGRQRNKAQQVDPTEEQHGDGRANQHHSSAEVRLGQQQRGNRAQHQHRLDKAGELLADFFLTTHQVGGDKHHAKQLGQLGWL